ncbi:MAG: helix-turn-helix domain-containing protein [Rhizobiaceae bacterium]
MAGKLFIGRKVREVREANKLTQAAFAERLGISTSYLNQIENNQRSTSAAVLLALAEKFDVDIASLAHSDHDRVLSALVETLADPVFDGYSPSLQELKLVTQNAPGFAKALLEVHQAYRRNGEQLASLDDRLGSSTTNSDPTPYEEVRDFFHFSDNYVDVLDRKAERLASQLEIPENETGPSLLRQLAEWDVRTIRAQENSHLLRRYDPATRTLTLNAYASQATRNFQAAYQLAMFEAENEVEAIVEGAAFRTKEAAEICRIGLRNYFAGALTLPYELFRRAAKEQRHDLHLLSLQFDASLEQVAHRLSTLQRPNSRGTPVFFARMDHAGNITKRHSASKLQFARYGAACPLWNVHQAFEHPGRILRQLAQTPDGARYLCIATEVVKADGGYSAPCRRYAIALGCEITYAQEFVYATGLALGNQDAFEPIGISCRICDRADCPQRAIPPLRYRLEIDHQRRDVVPYRLAD